MKDLTIGLERIKIDFGSKPAKDLTDLFQSIIDLREEINEEPDFEKIVLHKVLSLNPKIINIFKDLGILLREVHWSGRPNCFFGIRLTLKNDSSEWIKLNDAFSGLKKESHSITAKELTDLGKSFQKPNTSFFSINKIPIECGLFLDPFTMFLSNEFISKTISEMTASEITAIVLHEIGHFMVTMEKGKEESFQVNAYLDDVSYFNKFADNNEKLKFIEMNTNDKNVLKTLSGMKKNKQNLGDSVGGKVFLLYMSILTVLILPRIIINIFSKYDSGSAETNIDNDLKTTTASSTLSEKLADEYVSALGYGKYLSNSLIKIDMYLKVLKLKSPSRSLYDINKVIFLDNISKAILKKSDSNAEVYLTIVVRLESILRDNIKILRQSDISKEERELLVNSCTYILENIKVSKKKLSKVDSLKVTEQFLAQYLSPKGIKDLLSGKLDIKYIQLQKTMDRITNNNLFLIREQFKKFL